MEDEDDAPEVDNAEQDDEPAQAQEVARQARAHDEALGLTPSAKVPTGADSDDVADLVDHINQMDRSGMLDYSAYRGERNDDDEEGLLGEAIEEDDEDADIDERPEDWGGHIVDGDGEDLDE